MKFLKDLWDETQATQWTFTGFPARILAVKGSGGDLGSTGKRGFALLYLDKLEALQKVYRGRDHEDEMVNYYPRAAFGESRVAPSIDTPLHAYLPFACVEHLHPDWGIAVAVSADGKEKLAEFNRRFGRRLAWLPWQRPGFELALRLRRTIDQNPSCDGVVLGGHGLLTWGDSPRECYSNTLMIIDQLGEFVLEHQARLGGRLFGGARITPRTRASNIAIAVLPFLRGKLATERRSIGHYNPSPDVIQFVNSQDAEPLARLGISCPDYFLRTRIRPLYIDWNPETDGVDCLKEKIAAGTEKYREEYVAYYRDFARPDSPPLRDPNPSVVLVPGVGMFTFGKSKAEARITGEFYESAIHVMAGATALGEGNLWGGPVPQALRPEDSSQFASFNNYVALPVSEAFQIEYWELEVAKLCRTLPKKELGRKIFLVVGGGSGIGRATAQRLAQLGAHVVIADKDEPAAAVSAADAARITSQEAVVHCKLDLVDRSSIAQALEKTVLLFGGLDGIVNTAAVFIPPDGTGHLDDDQWRRTLGINIAGNYFLADEARLLFRHQGLPTVLVLTTSANAVVPKWGSEAYDVSKSAVSHLVRELAVGLAPLVRVNAIAPATVVEASSMFPRDRVMASLTKYQIPFNENDTTEHLRNKLSHFYAQRTLTKLPITPQDCAEAICWLASDRAAKTTGHVIPVDGGLVEAFLR
ncbi:MAG: bifunctional rhamnulose-1-phosphate aldolase/short-chain dehydrogenase [Acidobacteriia bacterium]|nr:bifunctional rhamnulose-1-phosphate aldolase/short-chain dehydrogenase [Terriglobia bacterium]